MIFNAEPLVVVFFLEVVGEDGEVVEVEEGLE
jgi:hypothetical protein